MSNKKTIIKIPESIVTNSSRLIILWFVALLPIIFNPFGFNMYATPRVWLLYTVTISLLGLFVISLISREKKIIQSQPLTIHVAIFASVLLISTLLSVHSYSSLFGNFLRFEGLFAWISYLLLFLFAHQLFREKKDIEKLFKYLALSSGAISIYAILQHFGYDFLSWQEGLVTDRAFSTLGNPAYLGAYLALVLPLMVRLALFYDQKPSKKLLYFGSSSLMMIALAFTLTRGAWLAVALALLLLLILRAGFLVAAFKDSKRRLVLGAIIFLILITLSVSTGLARPYVSRLAAMTSNEGSVMGRLLIWKQVLPLVIERPIFGSGPDTLYLTFSTQITPEYERKIVRDTATDRAHNELLQITATSGFLGLLGFLSVIGGFFFISFRARRKAPPFWLASIDGVLLGAFSYLLMIQTHFSTVDVSPIFWILMGVGLSSSQRFITKNNSLKTLNIKPLSKTGFAASILTISALILMIGWFSFKPVIADVHFRQAKRLSNSSTPRLAIESYRLAADYHNGSDYYLRELSNAYIILAPQAKDPSYFIKAIETSKKATDHSPLNVYNHLTLGNAYLESYLYSGDQAFLNKAQETFKVGAAIDSNYAELRYKLGLSFAYLKDEEAALSEWGKVIKLSPKAISARINIGQIYDQRKEYVESKKYYNEVLSIDPENEQAKQLLEKIPF